MGIYSKEQKPSEIRNSVQKIRNYNHTFLKGRHTELI